MRAAIVLSCAMLLGGPAVAAEYRLRVVARVGAPAPAGGVFDGFSAGPEPVVVGLNRDGAVAFFSKLVRAAASEGLFVSRPARTVRIAAAGDRVPGAGVLTGFGPRPVPALNNRGAVAFHASLSGGGAVEGIFTAPPGRPPRAIVLSGQPAPGIAAGTIAGLDSPALNDSGAVAFVAMVRQGRDTLDAIYLGSRGRLRKVVARGDPAPIGGSFAGFGPPSLNDRGVVAFAALIEGGRALAGLFLAEPAGGIRTVAATGDETPLGGYYIRFGDRLSLNDAGQVAFHGVVSGGSSTAGIFLAGAAAAHAVATVGGASPIGGHFESFGLWPALAADGAVAFVGAIDGGDVPVAVVLARGANIEVIASAGSPSPAGRIASFGLYPSVALSGRTLAFPVVPTAAMPGAEAILAAEPR